MITVTTGFLLGLGFFSACPVGLKVGRGIDVLVTGVSNMVDGTLEAATKATTLGLVKVQSKIRDIRATKEAQAA